MCAVIEMDVLPPKSLCLLGTQSCKGAQGHVWPQVLVGFLQENRRLFRCEDEHALFLHLGEFDVHHRVSGDGTLGFGPAEAQR